LTRRVGLFFVVEETENDRETGFLFVKMKNAARFCLSDNFSRQMAEMFN
jgi:hypothetical protein